MSLSRSVRSVVSDEIQRPPIPLKDGKNKIRLQLRKMSFQRELDGLPSQLKALVELLIQSRSRGNGSIYERVIIWNRLRSLNPRYWAEFTEPFRSEADFLTAYSLEDGAKLGRWSAMVELFDQSTFILLGEEILNYMMSAVSQWQTNPDDKKRDYATIFQRYCRSNDAFDRLSFYGVVREYVFERYEKPLAKDRGMSRKEWLRDQAKKKTGKKSHLEVIKAAKGQTLAPRLQRDFAWKQDECHYCGVKTNIIRDFQRYVQALETFAKNHAGDDPLPEKPESLKSLESVQ